MKPLWVFLLPPGWDASPAQVTPSIKFAGTHFYTWVERGTVRVKFLAQEHNTMSPARAPFLEGPEKFLHPESHSKIPNLVITELFNLRILNMTAGSLHTRSFRRIHLSVFTGPKSFRGFRETGPRARTRTARSGDERTNHEATAPLEIKSWLDIILAAVDKTRKM